MSLSGQKRFIAHAVVLFQDLLKMIFNKKTFCYLIPQRENQFAQHIQFLLPKASLVNNAENMLKNVTITSLKR